MCEINQTESRLKVSGHFTAFRPLGDIGSTEATKPLIRKLGQYTLSVNKSAIYRSLGNIGDANSWDILVQALKSETWYHVTQPLASLVSIDPVEALPYVYKALENDHPQVRRKAIMLKNGEIRFRPLLVKNHSIFLK